MVSADPPADQPPTAPNAEPSAPAALSDEDLLRMSQGETIQIYDERPDKPFDRDTEIRLTGEQLAARGATDLASALALLPDVAVRDAGRGGFNVDIRGQRKGEVSILIDGVLVTDPWYGTFDVSTIPITDIVQIRMSTTPLSPIDGPGGPGGVIEVLTRDAIGPQLVIARLTGDTLPTFGVTGTARAPLSDHTALRFSASDVIGGRQFDLPAGTNAVLNEDRHAADFASRLEYRDGNARVALDGFVDDRHYVAEPSDEDPALGYLEIDRETTERFSLKADDKIGKTQVQGEAWYQHGYTLSRYFTDPELNNENALEDLRATRVGGMALVTRPIGKEARWAASFNLDHDSADVGALAGPPSHGDVTVMEGAVDGQYEHKTLRFDASVGAAIPIGVGADPWPEAKLVGKWRPHYGPLELTATAARKGRVPSLRERFDLATGNPALGPEQAYFAEIRAVEHINDRLHVELAPFYRHTTGTIRTSTDPADDMRLVNLGKLDYWGGDLLGRVRVHPLVELGGAYDYIVVRQEAQGTTPAVDDPLDRLPHNRWEAWAQATPYRDVSALVRVTYFGESINQLVHVPGYTLLLATVTWQISPKYLLVLRGDDLLDARPETRAGYHSAGRTITAVFQAQWQ